ncbi:hypothetical protein AVEN_93899-1 [Araneus ventricosus]|uniref:DUF6570 domain-containing protein n=1 Tax=Araneus ventricosus TaxID=182803 RepID=A0A4Y2AXU5_ARAVE|nr:hypothetical protein AVEN_93899-1 [Araneus ventricosus]
MPKLKHKSAQQQQNLRRDAMRSLRNKKGDAQLLLDSIKEHSHLMNKNANLLRQKNYLSKVENRLLRNQRNQSSQNKRLSESQRREEHNERLKTAQLRRLSSQEKRALHLEKLKEAQRIRLSNPQKCVLHCKRLLEAKSGRLSSPNKRVICLKKLQEAKISVCLDRVKELCITKGSKRDNISVCLVRVKELYIAKGCKRDSKRLSIPSKRAVHLKRLQDGQKKRLLDPVSRRKHCQLLLNDQRRRLLDPAGHIIHISRVLSSKLQREEKDKKFRKKLFENFIKEKKEGPSHTCHSCNRLWFRTSVKWVNIGNLNVKALVEACGSVEGNQVCLCSNCNNYIKQKKLPKYSLARERLKFPNVPDAIKSLTDLEERFVWPRIPFMTIRAAISDQQYLVKGRAINVPTNVSTSVNVLPRNADDTLVLPVVFRRKKIDKTNVAFENVRPHVIKAAAECLRNSPLYQYFNIELSSQATMNNGIFKTSQCSVIDEAFAESFAHVDDDFTQAPATMKKWRRKKKRNLSTLLMV